MIDSKYLGRATSLLLMTGLTVVGQSAPNDVAPLKNWATPLYWQPSQAERENVEKSGAQIQFSPHATSNTALIFVAVSPCRMVDTRGASAGFIGSAPFNGPFLSAGQTVTFPVQSATETATTAPSPCGAIPSVAQAYSLNLTIVPHPFGTPVNYVTMWPTGVTIPQVSTLNDQPGTVAANAAIVPAGTPNGGINVFAFGATDVIIDMNGFYAAPTDLNSNTAIGASTLSTLTSGVDNTAVGQSALNANTTGGDNTAVGFGAGVTATSANANSSGSNNTYLGFQCGASTSTQLNNSFCLGAGALFGASNTGVLGNSSVTDVYFGGTTAQAVAHALSVSLTGTSTGATKVITANNSSANYTITVPNPSGAADTFCLMTLANCGSSSGGSSPTGPAGGILSGSYPNPGFAPIATGTFLGNFTGATAPPGATTLATAKLCQAVSTPLASAIRIDNGAGCALDSLATYTVSGLNIPSGTAYLYGGVPIATAQPGSSNFYFGNAGNLTGTGSGNTASGYGALLSNTTGIDNTAIGVQALVDNTTGSANTANGFNALYFNTTGNDNTATGYGAMGLNTTGGLNTATGVKTLFSNTVGIDNTATGYQAMLFNTSGSDNTASGWEALYSNTSGTANVAFGSQALYTSTNAGGNVAIGDSALLNSTGGLNTAIGYAALDFLGTGTNNIAIGAQAATSIPGTSSNNIHIGNVGAVSDNATIKIGNAGIQTSAYIAGIAGANVGSGGAPVYVNNAGQLGIAASSRRFKEQITDMGDSSSKLLQLRPVTFLYKPEYDDGSHSLQYGLIAEEVEKIYPEMVIYDSDGKIMTVKYQLLAPMLLNEVQKLAERNQRQDSRIRSQAEAIQLQQGENRKLEDRLAALEALLSSGTTAAKSWGSQ